MKFSSYGGSVALESIEFSGSVGSTSSIEP